ncbi:MAG: ATP-binding cassette domain-containing protein, partial [Holophagales bacterium]|nr:ATP-binding cassette domain-containing protein [Holophagales bacterium]
MLLSPSLTHSPSAEPAAIDDSGSTIHFAQFGKRYSRLWPPQADTWAVRGLDLEVKAGEILALIGPNGAGKTTALMALMGLE